MTNREIDALVTERVMGSSVCRCDPRRELPRFSADTGACLTCGNQIGGNYVSYTLQRKISAWYRSHGGHATLNAAIDRAVEECQELNFAATPADIREEMADVGMCLMMAAEIAGFDLMGAIREKLDINLQRQWTVDDEGCLHHVKGSDPRQTRRQM